MLPMSPLHATVVVPTYNTSSHPDPLDATLGSVLHQDYGNYDVVVIDDASTDDTIDQVQRVVRESGFDPSRLHLIACETNRGVAGTANDAFDWIFAHLPGTDYIARCDSDDIMYPHRLTHQVAVMESRPDVDVLGSNVRSRGINTHGKAVDKALSTIVTDDTDIKTRMLFACPIHHTTAMFRAASFESPAWRYNEAEGLHEDYDLWCQIAAGGGTFHVTDEVVGVYTVRPGSETSNQDKVTDARSQQAEMFNRLLRDAHGIDAHGHDWLNFVLSTRPTEQVLSWIDRLRSLAAREDYPLNAAILDIYLRGFRL